MSTWHALAIERLGTPDPSWGSIYGPTADDVAALRSLDLTPNGMPMDVINQSLERDFLRASLGQMNLSFSDPDGSLATQLGPNSTLLATSTRYAGPWVQISEVWSGGSEVRFLGYVDELTIQWDEMTATTSCTVYSTAQLLAERKLTSVSALLRPFPAVPGGTAPSWVATTADAALQAEFGAYAPRSGALAIEQALWANGALTGGVGMASETVDLGGGTKRKANYAPPAAPALTLTIAGQVYAISGAAWDLSVSFRNGTEIWRPFCYLLAGTPNLSGVLAVGMSCTWNSVEAVLSHYQLVEDIPAPPSGADGQNWAHLQSIGNLVAGDTLTVTYTDTNNKTASQTWICIDLDGETNRAYLRDPINEALPNAKVIRIRRDSQDPVLVDGVELLRQAVAPWPVDTSHLLPALTSNQVLTWLPLDSATPSLYGATDLQVLDRAGRVRISRRGPTDSGGASPSAGIWEGSAEAGFAWTPFTDAATPVRQLGCLTQWPGGSNSLTPPSVWIDGDLSAGATIPPNGWRRQARSAATYTSQIPVTITQTWNGTAIAWASQAAVGAIPTRLCHFSAQSAAPGRYMAMAGVWTFEPHSGAGTLGSAATVTPSGLPAGSPLLLGMGAYASGGVQQEAILAVLATGAGPYTSANAAVLSIGAAGALTVRSSYALTTPQAGPWSLGGGLVLCTYPETLAGSIYPHTRLWLLDGGTAVEADLSTLEILPGTIQPLSLVAGRISGWLAIGLETYQDNNGQMQRRARLVQLDGALQVVNGDKLPSPVAPLDPTVAFRRGSLISDPIIPSGSLLGRMVRTGQGDRCLGLLGGRLFQVDTAISTVLERVALADLTALQFLEQLGQALLATGIPMPDGTIALVSRRSGTLRPTVPGGVEGQVSVCPVGSWIGEVRVSFQDAVAGQSVETVSLPPRSGGKVLSMDLTKVLGSPAQSQGVGDACAAHWGVPASLRTATWTDGALGLQADLPPPFWASYQVGDRIPTGGKTFKLLQSAWLPEDRQTTVDLLEIPGGGA